MGPLHGGSLIQVLLFPAFLDLGFHVLIVLQSGIKEGLEGWESRISHMGLVHLHN